MPTRATRIALSLGLSLAVCRSYSADEAAPPLTPTEDLPAGFAHPPAAAQPLTWWHWISGNVSKEGITADLEAMKKIGIGGAQLFTAEQSDVKGPVVFMSPEWRSLVHYAITESDRLGLELTMENCEGWSESGGPWIKPAQSMQKVVWSETRVAGGSKVPLDLPQPLTEKGYYEDIALLAFPTVRGDDSSAIPLIKTSLDNPGAAGTARPPGTVATLPNPTTDHPQWIRLEFDSSHSFTSLRIAGKGLRDFSGESPWELQSSEDGLDFKKVCSVPSHGTISFPESRGKFFRLWMPVAPPRTPRIELTELTLAGSRVDRPEARTGMVVDRNSNLFTGAQVASSGVVKAAAVVNLTGQTEWNAPAGDWTLVRIGHTSTGVTNHPASPATVGLECDKLSRAAVTTHFNQGMLGAVLGDAGDLAGKGIKYVLCDSWEAGCENWTPLMREDFKKLRGYDLEPWLPALTGRIVGSVDSTERFLWDYRRTLADLVADNHYGVLRELAHQHHLGLYAEAAGINLPTICDQLQCKGRTDIPMGEFWVGRTDMDDTKEAASAAHIYGQNIAGAESFTATTENGAWAKDPYSLKAQGDEEFCLGINRFIFHRYAHQPWLNRKPGMSMGPWGTNFERTNTWWDEASAWMTYITRCQYLLQRGHFAADVCYYYGESAPVDFRWDRMPTKLPAGYDFDACDSELLLHGMMTRGGRLTLPSGMSYRVLLLPDTNRMSLPVLSKVRDLVRAGAIVVGPKPVMSPSLTGYPKSDDDVRAIADEVWGNCDGKTVTSHAFGGGKVFWGAPITEALSVPPDFSSVDPSLHYIHRSDGDAEIYFVANPADHETLAQCTFRVDGLIPELWHADSGRMETAALYISKGGRVTLPIHFDPVGSVFVVFRRPAAGVDPVAFVRATRDEFSADAAARDQGAPLGDPPVSVDGKLELTVWQPGSYSFTTASGKTLSAEASDIPTPVELSGPWNLQFPPNLGAPPMATFEKLASWSDSKTEGIRYFSGTASYSKTVVIAREWLSEGSHILLDLGTVKNLAEVSLNGKNLGILWKAPFRLDVTGVAKAGANLLEIKVTNLWPNRMIGDQKLPESKRITWASFYPYKADSPLLPSGLLGPVTLRLARQIEVAP